MSNEITFEQLQEANATIKTRTLTHRDKKTGQIIETPYAEVNQRIKAFRMLYPQGFIETDLRSLSDEAAVFVARVGYRDESGRCLMLGEGTAREEKKASFINQTSYVENAENSAVGRALGMAGFGIDTSIASAEEVENAKAAQEAATAHETPEKPQPQPLRDLSSFTTLKQRLVVATGLTEAEARQQLIEVLGNPSQMTDDQYKEALKNGEAYVATAERNAHGN